MNLSLLAWGTMGYIGYQWYKRTVSSTPLKSPKEPASRDFYANDELVMSVDSNNLLESGTIDRVVQVSADLFQVHMGGAVHLVNQSRLQLLLSKK